MITVDFISFRNWNQHFYVCRCIRLKIYDGNDDGGDDGAWGWNVGDDDGGGNDDGI